MQIDVRKVPAKQLQEVFSETPAGNPYVEALKQYAPGEGGIVSFRGTTEAAAKRMLTLAAKQLGWLIQWPEKGRQLPGVGPNELYFRIAPNPPVGTTTNGDGRNQPARDAVRVTRGRKPATITV